MAPDYWQHLVWQKPQENCPTNRVGYTAGGFHNYVKKVEMEEAVR